MKGPVRHSGDDGRMPDFDDLFDRLRDHEPATKTRLLFLRMILGLAEEWEQVPHQAEASLALAEELQIRGDLIETQRLADSALDLARECGRHDLEGDALALLARGALNRKDRCQAEELLRQAAECMKIMGQGQKAFNLEERRAKILISLERYDEALKILQEMPDLARRGRIGILEAKVLWSLGRREEALSRIDELTLEFKMRSESGWHMGHRFFFHDLVEFLEKANLLERKRQLLEWRISTIQTTDLASLRCLGQSRIMLAKYFHQVGMVEKARQSVRQAVPFLGETDSHMLFEGLALAAKLGTEEPGRWDPWLLAFETLCMWRLEKHLTVLGKLLPKDSPEPALAALAEAKRRYQESGNQLGEARAWLITANYRRARQESSTKALQACVSRALRLARSATDIRTEVECLLFRSSLQQVSGNTYAGHRAAIRAHSLAEKLGDTELLLETSLNLASSQLRRSEPGTVCKTLNLARLLVNSLDHELEQLHWARRIEDVQKKLHKFVDAS